MQKCREKYESFGLTEEQLEQGAAYGVALKQLLKGIVDASPTLTKAECVETCLILFQGVAEHGREALGNAEDIVKDLPRVDDEGKKAVTLVIEHMKPFTKTYLPSVEDGRKEILKAIFTTMKYEFDLAKEAVAEAQRILDDGGKCDDEI